MTQPFDEQMTRAFDSLSERLHAQIADQLLVTAGQIAAAAESDRQAVAEAAARDAAAVAEQQATERLRHEFASREEQLKEAARAEWFEAGQQHMRSEALAIQSARDADAQAAADAAAAQLDDHRAQLDDHRAQLLDLRSSSARIAEEHADALATLRAEQESAVTSLRAEHEAVLASLHAEYDAELASARAELDAARLHVQAAHADAQAALAAAAARAGAAVVPAHGGTGGASQARVLSAVRALDTASSLSQTLDTLFTAARAEARRVAVFLVRGDILRTWNHAGFDAVPVGSAFELPLEEAGLIADAVRAAASRRLGADGPGRPAFAAASPAGPLVAVPLAMNGQVFAVLCGEEDAGSPDSLTPTFELLARHAARVLESLTALRFAQLVPPAGAGSTQPR